MYNIVKRNRVKVRSVDYIGYDLLSINFTRNTVKRKNGIDEYPYAPLLTYSTRQRAVYLRVTCRIIMNPRNCINYPGLLTRYRFNRGKKPIDRFMYSIYEPNRVFNHCDRFAKCCLFNSCNNLFPIHRMPAPRRISIDRKEIFNQKEKSYIRSKYSGDDLIAASSGNEQTAFNTLLFETKGASIIESNCWLVDHCALLPCENFLNPFFFYRIRARAFDVSKENGDISSRQRKIYSMGDSK